MHHRWWRWRLSWRVSDVDWRRRRRARLRPVLAERLRPGRCCWFPARRCDALDWDSTLRGRHRSRLWPVALKNLARLGTAPSGSRDRHVAHLRKTSMQRKDSLRSCPPTGLRGMPWRRMLREPVPGKCGRVVRRARCRRTPPGYRQRSDRDYRRAANVVAEDSDLLAVRPQLPYAVEGLKAIECQSRSERVTVVQIA